MQRGFNKTGYCPKPLSFGLPDMAELAPVQELFGGYFIGVFVAIA